jgi:hypothetical protein
MVIKSVNGRQEDLIKDIMTLYEIPQIDLDTTYSKGSFYKNGIVQEPKLKMDKFPQTKDTFPLSWALLADNSMNCIMFDPPFIIVGSGFVKSGGETCDKSIIAQRFYGFSHPRELFETYKEHLVQYYRILKDDGFLIFKCQDTTSSSKNYFTHAWIWKTAVEIGYDPLDLFVLVKKSRLLDPRIKKQRTARKYHSYFWIFKKRKQKAKYSFEEGRNW